MSIDSDKRIAASKLIQNWVDGLASNYDLEDGWPENGGDGALAAIAERFWMLYDDFPQSYLDRSALPEEQQALVERSIAFLKSDCEYKWPSFSYITGNLSFLSRVLPGASRRRSERIRNHEFTINQETWPFHPSQTWGSREPELTPQVE